MKRSLIKKESIRTLIWILPGLIPLLFFWIMPILQSIGISFTDWDYMTPSFHFVFFKNYISLLKDSSFYQALTNTLLFGLGTVIPSILLGLLAALLVQNLGKASTIYKLAVFSPWITPTVAVSIVWTWMFDQRNGILNSFLSFFGLPECPWISDSRTALISVILVTVWKSVGYVMIFYIAALARVPSELKDAARADGAGSVRCFQYITWPMIRPTTSLLTVILTIQSLQAYDSIQILTQGGPSGSTRTLLYLYYQLGFEQFQMGQATAAVVILLIITLVMSLIQYHLTKRQE